MSDVDDSSSAKQSVNDEDGQSTGEDDFTTLVTRAIQRIVHNQGISLQLFGDSVFVFTVLIPSISINR